jgi:arylsulfatase A-like enzyme
MKTIPLYLSLILLIIFPGCLQKSTAPSDPNILLINVDDLGWVDPGFMGHPYYETPYIDSLAAEGRVFTKGYAGASNCGSSRACMITGLNSPRHGIFTALSSERGESRDRKIIPIVNTAELHDSLTTLAEALQVFGYTTLHAGKWPLSKEPCDHGFDYNIGGNGSGSVPSYSPPYINPELEAHGGDYLTDNIMSRVLEFIDNNHGDPLFIHYAPYALHPPIKAIDSLLYKFENKPGPAGMSNPEYATMIHNLDLNIGRLISKLKALDLYRNTFIIFTSDNGGSYGISKQKPLRAGKGSYYEGGIRVPMIFVWSGEIKPGLNHDIAVHHLDLFPTILEIVGAQMPGKQFDGVSLVPLLMEEREPSSRPLFWHFPVYLEGGNSDTRDTIFRTRPGSMVIKDNWKLIYYFEEGDVELFNLKEDPGETENLAYAEKEKRYDLLNILNEWWIQTDAPIPTKLNPEFVNRP